LGAVRLDARWRVDLVFEHATVVSASRLCVRHQKPGGRVGVRADK
jgi:hypothetical protein